MKFSEITSQIQHKGLTDFVLQGYTDNEAYQKPECYFHIMLDRLYLIFEDKKFIRLSSILSNSQLELSFSQGITPGFEVDEDDTFCACSLREFYGLDYHTTNKIMRITCFLDQESDLDAAIVKCLEVHMSNGKIFFFDPTHYFGIFVGDNDYAKRWIVQNKVVIDEFGVYTWKPEEIS